MGGRNTPSPGLLKAANYIAGEFKRFGLRPGGDSGDYLLRYPIVRKQLLAEQSRSPSGPPPMDARQNSALAPMPRWPAGADFLPQMRGET